MFKFLHFIIYLVFYKLTRIISNISINFKPDIYITLTTLFMNEFFTNIRWLFDYYL